MTSWPGTSRRRRSRSPTAIGSTGSGRAPACCRRSSHQGTALGDQRLADALALSAEHDLAVLWARRERPRAAALLARAIAEDLPGADTAAALAAGAGREVLHDAVSAVAGRPAALARLADAVDEETDVNAETMRLLLAEDDPGVAAAAERARAVLERRPRQPIRIETFGGLRVYRAGARVPDTAFTRAKARALLGALVCAGARGAHRDRLLEHLWPDLAPERGARALDTTLHELRRTLEPARRRGPGGSLVVREGELYRLALGDRDSWDAGEFLELAARRRRARPTTSPWAGCSAPRPCGAATSCRTSPTSRGRRTSAGSWSTSGSPCWSAWPPR